MSAQVFSPPYIYVGLFEEQLAYEELMALPDADFHIRAYRAAEALQMIRVAAGTLVFVEPAPGELPLMQTATGQMVAAEQARAAYLSAALALRDGETHLGKILRGAASAVSHFF